MRISGSQRVCFVSFSSKAIGLSYQLRHRNTTLVKEVDIWFSKWFPPIVAVLELACDFPKQSIPCSASLRRTGLRLRSTANLTRVIPFFLYAFYRLDQVFSDVNISMSPSLKTSVLPSVDNNCIRYCMGVIPKR